RARWSMRLGPASFCFVLVGCGPAVDLDEGGGSHDGTTTTATTGSGADATTSTGADTTGPDATSSSPTTSIEPTTGTTGSEGTTGEPESVCDPQPQDVHAGIEVDDGEPPDFRPTSPLVYVDCMAEPLSRQGDAYTLSLTCADGPHEVRFQSGFVPSGFSSAPLELTVHWTQATFGGGDVLVVLRDAGQVVLAGSRGPLLAGRGDVPPDLWAPLSVELLPDVCDIEPEVPGDSGFIAPCFQVQRQALRFSLDGTSVDVYDHGMGELGPLWVTVEHAEQRHEIACTDTSSRWYQWVATYPFLE
ncbi:MAG: hypothetical protein KDK70_41215, partial [Myxococcales bacterium]|nr:hypothetical protein [Myxococcales bacterium]